MDVSIHTPIQGVTGKQFEPLNHWTVSIHTPIQGVTDDAGDITTSLDVSIHTPIQGVTGKDMEIIKPTKFQSTHPYRV